MEDTGLHAIHYQENAGRDCLFAVTLAALLDYFGPFLAVGEVAQEAQIKDDETSVR